MGTENATTSADIGPIASPEAVNRQIEMKLRDPYIHADLLDFVGIGTAPSYRDVFEEHGDPAPESPADETDEIPAENMSWTDVTATPAMFATRGALSDEARGNTDKGLLLRSVSKRVDNCIARIEKVTVEMSSLAATVIGDDLQPMGKDFFIQALSQFRTMSGGDTGNIAWVMHPDVFGVFTLSLGDAAGTIFGANTPVAQDAAQLMAQQQSGKMGRWLNCDIYTSPFVPQNGAGRAGMLLRTGVPATPRGRQGSVLKFVWKPPPVGEGADEVRVEIDRSGKDSRTDTIGRVWFSIMLSEQERIAQVITAA